MPVTGSDITRNADLFKAAYPNWPHAETGAGLVWPGEPVPEPVGADGEPGDLYGPDEGE